ncbi:4-diphosphocytidyl-2-C-methyl-D-erythritol kinase [Anaerotignum neopropionicum]|uniref:4-diphosphocytidyl-2-C-methyl-D-erythritol kinase n=1 Tax=Anaerotignum neopropionicum TaxID=36847 RepID=A0A136WC47_9FIRM|nr:4-(cytidine 5'-diphospho)-2-C-methyl-D-erythritol kinase [Anaerotignum neopropionicum]KXL52054.1 4-diphosphocytidyl-2-C-methyl-D-erythritol kinase [Anaerotignum neopropionicum]
MRELRLKARAKINLTLDVTGKREDGYHLIKSIMQTVSLYDGIYMKRIRKNEIIIKNSLPWLPTDNRNLAYKAAELMKERFDITEGVYIEIDKRIPVAAGLAGGSADCAAVLVGMNRLFGLGLSMKELEHLAFLLGSDIPYCVQRGTMLSEGVGEILTPVKCACPMCYVVLAKLPVSVSTAMVYSGLDWKGLKNHPDTEGMIQAMAEKDITKMGGLLANVLETVTIPMYPKIAQIKEEMARLGAEGALMSGSGPTVFGLFKEEEDAKQAATSIRKKFGLKEVVATRIYHVNEGKRGEDGNGRNEIRH